MTRLYHDDAAGSPHAAAWPGSRPQAHPGLVLGAIEAPAGQDEQLGQLFQQMRQATGLTSVMLAARLGIHPATLALFESGAVLALPEWNETARIVSALARLVGLDPSVALERIRSQRHAGPVQHPSNARTPAAGEPMPAAIQHAAAPMRAPGPAALPPVPLPPVPAQPRQPNGLAALASAPPVHPSHVRQASSHHVPTMPPPSIHPSSSMHPSSMPLPPGSPHVSYAAHPPLPPAAVMPPPRSMPGAPAAASSNQHWAHAPAPAPMMPHAQHAAAQSMPAHSAPPHARLYLAPVDAASAGTPHLSEPLSPINPLQPPPRVQQRAPSAVGGLRSSADVPRRRASGFSYKLLAAPIVLVPALWYTVQNPTTVHAALDQLPEPIPRIARAGMDIVLIGTASTKDGMRLITVADPRNRKGDKLPTR